MSLKDYLCEMQPNYRRAFLQLEKMITVSKIECISLIPKNTVYNDSEIKKKIQSIESKINKLDNLITNYIEYIKIEISNLKNAHNNVVAETRMVDDYLSLFDALSVLNKKIAIKTGYIDDELEKSFNDVRKIAQKILKQRDIQNKTYDIYLKSGGEPQEEYMKK